MIAQEWRKRGWFGQRRYRTRCVCGWASGWHRGSAGLERAQWEASVHVGRDHPLEALGLLANG